MSTSPEIKVWDPLVRIFHWSLALSFLIGYFTGDEVLVAHVFAGYVAMGLVAFRLVWGVIGTRHARFLNFVLGPSEVFHYLKRVAAFRAERHVGHNPAGGAMAVALLLFVTLTGISGLALYGATEFSGPLAPYLGGLSHEGVEIFEEFHEFFANATAMLVLIHIIGVAVASLQHHENLVRAMFTGRKRPITEQ